LAVDAGCALLEPREPPPDMSQCCVSASPSAPPAASVTAPSAPEIVERSPANGVIAAEAAPPEGAESPRCECCEALGERERYERRGDDTRAESKGRGDLARPEAALRVVAGILAA
jgi:hypothetical protein